MCESENVLMWMCECVIVRKSECMSVWMRECANMWICECVNVWKCECVFCFFFYSLFYVDTNFLFTNLQIVLSI